MTAHSLCCSTDAHAPRQPPVTSPHHPLLHQNYPGSDLVLAHHQMCQADLSPLCFLVCLSLLAVAALPTKGEHPQLADLVRSESGPWAATHWTSAAAAAVRD